MTHSEKLLAFTLYLHVCIPVILEESKESCFYSICSISHQPQTPLLCFLCVHTTAV